MLAITVRLACVKHAASVRSEPGSNSQVHPAPRHRETKRTNPELHSRFSPVPRGVGGGKPPRKSLRLYCVCEIHLQHPQSSQPSKPGSIPAHTNQPPSPLPRPPLSVRKNQWDAASVSLPFRFTSQRTKPGPTGPTPYSGTKPTQPSRRLATARPRARRPSRRRRFRRSPNPGQPPRARAGN